MSATGKLPKVSNGTFSHPVPLTLPSRGDQENGHPILQQGVPLESRTLEEGGGGWGSLPGEAAPLPEAGQALGASPAALRLLRGKRNT